jgi:hypothetical protein
MTSEIAVMNQRAVALAADSAVTLIAGGTVVVRNEHQKLFNLVEGRPIGLMFFGMADLLGHPWDHLIEHYQKKVKPGALAHVRDYAASFVNALDNLEEFFPNDRQADDYRRLLLSVGRYILRHAEDLRSHGSEASSDTAIVETAIEQIWRFYQYRPDGNPRPDLACFPEGFGKRVLSEHAGVIDEFITYGFGQYGIGKVTQQHLRDIAMFCVIKELFLEDVAGLVFAGFGAEERYPALVTYYVSAIVCGIVKRAELGVDQVNNEQRSALRIFADSAATTAFIRGIDSNLENWVYGNVQAMMHRLAAQLIEAFPNADAASREAVRGRFLDELGPRHFEAFYRAVAEYQQRIFINPVFHVLDVATRKELAETARQLVELNVFKKRIMAQKETVGGAIDVCIISRDDGFQWASKGGVER